MNWKNFTLEQIQAARETVANDWIELAHAILKEDSYASHVTEETKENQLIQMLESAEQCRKSEKDHNFTFWQRINTELTGQCVALLP